jgi:Tol biopolymer transport system component
MAIDAFIVTEIIHGYAGRLAWSPDGRTIIFDKIPEDDPDRYFDLWEMTDAGNIRRCLTKDQPVPPWTSRHIGQPAWHPSGELLVYQAEKQDIARYYDAYATPGCGIQNDLYVMDAAATWTTCVYASAPVSGGVLHPHFNRSGTKLSWTEYVGTGRSPLGHWVLKQAAFSVETGQPMVTNIETADPGSQPDWLENHGYDPLDDRYLLVSGTPNGERPTAPNIYAYDTYDLALIRLTDNPYWEEHAHCSPSGEWIVFMRGLEPNAPLAQLETELWIMRRDGSHQQQLTYFHTPGHPHFVSEAGVVCADFDWHPDGRQLAVFTQSRLSNQGEIRRCALDLRAL